MHQKKQKTWTKHFDFMFLDLLFVEISFVLSYIFRFGIEQALGLLKRNTSTEPYHYMMLMILFLHFAIMVFANQYSNIIYMLIGIVVVLFMIQSSDSYSRIVVFVWPVIGTFLMFVYKYFYKKYLRKVVNRPENQSCMLLVAPAHKIPNILRGYNSRQIITSRIVGIILVNDEVMDEAAATTEVEMRKDGDIQGIPIVGTVDTMYDYAGENVVDEVLLYMDGKEAQEAINTFRSMGIVVHVSIRDRIQMPNATINRVNGIPVITSSVNNVTARQLIIKRLIDIFFGLIGSIVTVLLTIIIAPMMMIADPGPIFFRQERVGKNGRIFKIWKFRTMYTDAEARKAELMSQNKMDGLMFKMDDDPRIIGYGKKFSLGKFLRETSLDEMPQSFNILAGSMSVVGTRPPTKNEYEQYQYHHRGRLAMMPGLTGMWQVSGRSDITDFEEVVALDKQYIENFSLMLDFEIMLKTFKVVLGKEGSV